MVPVRRLFVFLFLIALCSPALAAVPGASPQAAQTPRAAPDPAPPADKASGILLLETTDSYIDDVLLLEGLPFVTYTAGYDWENVDLGAFEHVFVGMDGGSILEPAVLALADFAAAGGKLHMIGGTSYQAFVSAVNSYLLHVDVLNYFWTINATPPDIIPRDILDRLLRGLDTYTFVDRSASFYQLRITDPDARVAAYNGSGWPVLVTKRLGAGYVDVYTNSPRLAYHADAGDFEVVRQIVRNMLTEPVWDAGILVVGNTQTYLHQALESLEVPFIHSVRTDYENMDLARFHDVFLGADGGNYPTAGLRALRDYARAGGAFHLIGGTSLLTFNTDVDSLFVHIDLEDWGWRQNANPPDYMSVPPPHPLTVAVPTPYDYNVHSATYYQMHVIDPEAEIAGINGDGWPVLGRKFLGNGRFGFLANSPYYYTDAQDFAWFRRVVANMLRLGVPSDLGVVDVPDDQGRAVRLSWRASLYDGFYSELPVTHYTVWRRADGGEAKAYPPGTWDYVATVPARGEFTYQTVVPTLCDSTLDGVCWSGFFVSACTAAPTVYFDSDVVAGYSVDNLAPAPPTGLVLADAMLSWDDPVDEDFDYFTVWGSHTPDMAGAVMVGHTSGTSLDVPPPGEGWAYLLVTATDFAGNQGEPAVLLAASGLPDGGVLRNALLGNKPNPFNPSTVIGFSLATPQRVTLTVFDTAGRAVRTLIDGQSLGAAVHQREWDGRDDAGRAAAAGVYLYRLRGDRFEDTGRMVLVR